MNDLMYTIDKIQKIEINPNDFNNEFNALISLKSGMLTLYNSIKPVEISILEQTKGSKLTYIGASGSGIIPPELDSLLPCFFHWFANTLVNYARLTGFVIGKKNGSFPTYDDSNSKLYKKTINEFCNNYVASVNEIKEVVKWRNKVSAHFALTAPYKEDNIATLAESINFPISYHEGRLVTGLLVFSTGTDNNMHTSEIPKWSLTEVFEVLINRFWPDVVIKQN